MEFAIPGFIQRWCPPNALMTLQEYRVDCGAPTTRELGERLIRQQMRELPDGGRKRELLRRLERTATSGARDWYF